MEEVVIVGAGIAGLSCMNALLDLGIKPLLIEAGTIGTQKICGEFLSLEARLKLEAWNIGPIQKLQEIALSSHSASLVLKQAAGAISRSEVELQLAARARVLGGWIVENKKINKATANELVLSDGMRLRPKQLIIATGKLVSSFYKKTPYIGLKAHFLHDVYTQRLEMYLFKGGYFGIVPISSTTSNIACLVKTSAHNQAFIEMNRDLPWLSMPVGTFGFKKTPNWPNTYWIGDAIATLPPAIGGGFNHAIHSSILVAKHLINNDFVGYRRKIERHLKPKMRWAKLVHYAMLSQGVSNFTLNFLQKSPKVALRLLHRIGIALEE